MSESSNTSIEQLLADVIEEATQSKYCINCKLSSLNRLYGTGFCKFQEKDGFYSGHAKPIEEFDTCHHWTPKKTD